MEKFVIIARVHSLLSGATPHWYLAMIEAARGRESVHVVNINHVYLRVAGLRVFSSTFVFLSDCDVFVSTASSRNW